MTVRVECSTIPRETLQKEVRAKGTRWQQLLPPRLQVEESNAQGEQGNALLPKLPPRRALVRHARIDLADSDIQLV